MATNNTRGVSLENRKTYYAQRRERSRMSHYEDMSSSVADV